MKYIIMAGRSYANTDLPKQLFKIGGQTIIERTINLLKKHGVTDISISTNDDSFAQFGVPLLKHENTGAWINGFYKTPVPVCYIFGDVVFSDSAIKTIVETTTNDIQFFASAPPFADNYPKKWAEPFAFKVMNVPRFHECVERVRVGIAQHRWLREPIAWELWQVIKDTEWNKIDYTNYVAINDYTCDVDYVPDLKFYEDRLDMLAEEAKTTVKTTKYMIHTYPKRLWYVENFLIPSMLEQGIDKDNIIVYNDSKGEGNLRACMNAFAMVDDDDHGTWHLQDDVCICKDFKLLTEKLDFGLVCGFSSEMYDGPGRIGAVTRDKMWFSFPCLRIPNQYARDCSEWITKYIIGNFIYEKYWKNGVNDDWAFRFYLENFHKDDCAINLAPNLVDHVDYLLGGGSGKSNRPKPVRAQYWTDFDVVERLEKEVEKFSKK